MKVTREAGNKLTVSSEAPIYALENFSVVVIAPLRIKSAKVSFYTKEEWANIEKGLKESECPSRFSKDSCYR